MWDHGCAFGDNLTAQNITWGDCFEWNSALGWDFKTLEFFCPSPRFASTSYACIRLLESGFLIVHEVSHMVSFPCGDLLQGPTTCGCDRGKTNSACPQPQGLTCDVVSNCVLVENSYICRGEVPSVQGALDVDVRDEVLDESEQEVLQSLQLVLATLAGVAPATVKVEMAAGPVRRLSRRLRVAAVDFEIFLVEADPGQVEATLSSIAVETITASFQTQLSELVDAADAADVAVQSLSMFTPVKA
eukprot:Skav211045  [mRNA]  locus=scaffold1434:314153:314887:- [translate_table: standard]